MIKGEANLLEEGACMVQIYTIVIPLIRVAYNHLQEKFYTNKSGISKYLQGSWVQRLR